MPNRSQPTRPATPEHDAAWLRRFRRRLLAWYDRSARELPWRGTRDAYRIWVSEIMLQQTQVTTVCGYYERFLTRFPDVLSLAAADEQEVLRYWEGLGYYRRARQMHRAAGQIATEYAGRFPDRFEQVLALPGIGRYTAGAILSFAFDRPVPIVEANTERLYARLLAHREPLASSASRQRLWQFAEHLLPRGKPGRVNQALIELGATICLPRGPLCGQCPVQEICPTFQRNLQEAIPAPKRPMQYEDRREAALVLRRNGKLLLRKCGEGRRWAGLWDFPRFVMPEAPPRERSNGKSPEEVVQGELARLLAEQYGIEATIGAQLTTIRHAVTRFRITLDCFEARWRKGLPRSQPSSGPAEELVWASADELFEYPLSVTGRKISRLLNRQ